MVHKTMSDSLGTLYGVGVGPGDPDLITLRAIRVIRKAPVVFMPHSVNRDSVAFSVVGKWLRPKRQEIIYHPYPMMGTEEELDAGRGAVANQTVEFLQSGQDVAFVTEGDPLLYSTFIDLLDRCQRLFPDLSVQAVPGVTSITACASKAMVPLVRRSERLAVLSATDSLDDLERVIQEFDTVVLLKVRSVFDSVLDRLDRLGLTEAGVLVEECGRTEERITVDLHSRRGQSLSYFSTLLLCRTKVVVGAGCEK